MLHGCGEAIVRRALDRLKATDDEFFEQLSKEATSLVMGEDEQRQVDLKVLLGGG